jgi:hypothetical protein
MRSGFVALVSPVFDTVFRLSDDKTDNTALSENLPSRRVTCQLPHRLELYSTAPMRAPIIRAQSNDGCERGMS